MVVFARTALAALLLGSTVDAFFVTPKAMTMTSTTALFNGPVFGAGGMADTRDPDAFNDPDARKSISEAPSFEEYMKMRQSEVGGEAAAAPAVVPAPAPMPAPAPVPAWGAPAAAAPAWGAPAAPAPVPAPAPAWGAPAAPAWGAPAAPAIATTPAAPAWGTPPATAPVPAPIPSVAPVPAAGGSGSASGAFGQLSSSQDATVSRIAVAIPDLIAQPDLSWLPEDGITIAGSAATLDGRDAVGQSNMAWLSSLIVADKLSALTIFNGPLTDVPHFQFRCAVNADNMLDFTLDYRPRTYGAYEMVDADGNYPGPEELGRDAFTYSGNRKEYDTKFGTDEVKAFMDSTLASFDGAQVSSAPKSELELLTGGPLALSVTMPLTDGNIAAVIAARDQAVDYWIQWAANEADDHCHRPGAPINAQFVYDQKFRQNAYGALLPVYTDLFGPQDGPKLTAADSGPLDEAYVGGGS